MNQTMLLLFSLILFTGSFSLASEVDILKESAFASVCSSKMTTKFWSRSNLRYLQENKLFPTRNDENFDQSLERVNSYADYFSLPKKNKNELEDLVPPIYERARVALTSGLTIKDHLLSLQEERLESYYDFLKKIENCNYEKNTDCPFVKEHIQRLNTTIVDFNNHNSIGTPKINIDTVGEFVAGRIKAIESLLQNQNDAQLFLNDELLIQTYLDLGFDKSQENRELFCSVSKTMRYNTTEKERMAMLVNFYVDSFLYLSIGTAGTIASIKIAHKISFWTRIGPILAAEKSLKSGIDKLILSLIHI